VCDTRDPSNRYFSNLGANRCEACGDGAAHTPTIVLSSVMFALAVLSASIVLLKRKKILWSSYLKRPKELRQAASVKLRILFFTAQIVSQYATISKSANGGREHPQPASFVAGILGATNLALLQFAPMGCILPNASFYNRLLIKCFGPIVPIALMMAWPVSLILTGNDSEYATQFALRGIMVLLELLLPSISTTIFQTFGCVEFDDGFHLREQLTLLCDGSGRRKTWVAIASLMALFYPIGEGNTKNHPSAFVI